MEEMVTIQGVWQRETDQAIHLSVGEDVDIWIPKSLVNDCSVAYPEKGDFVELEVAEWFATKEDLI